MKCIFQILYLNSLEEKKSSRFHTTILVMVYAPSLSLSDIEAFAFFLYVFGTFKWLGKAHKMKSAA